MAHKIAVNLNVFSCTPLYEQVAQEIQKAVESGNLAFDERLPSIRELSAQLQISATTTRDALHLLEERGLIRSRQGSGNYVCAQVQERTLLNRTADTAKSDPGAFVEEAFQTKHLGLNDDFPWSLEAGTINTSFNQSSFHPFWDARVRYEFRVYQPPAFTSSQISQTRFPKMLAQLKRGGAIMHEGQIDPKGSLVLRRELARWLNQTRRLECSADDLFITSGAQHARDLVARLLVKRDDTVYVEEPGSITDLLAYASKGAHLKHVPGDGEGLDLDALRQSEGASILHLVGPANFPFASSMSIDRRLKLLEWAQINKAIIVEDAYGAGFYHTLPIAPALYALNQERNLGADVIYIGSLSQFVNPAFRLGFVLLPRRFHDQWLTLRAIADGGTSHFCQQVLINAFVSGGFEEHALRISQKARKRRQVMLDTLSQWPKHLVSLEPVDVGLHQPIRFNQSIDDVRVFESALKAGIGVIPLSPYFNEANKVHGLSLGFMQMEESQILAGLDELCKIIAAQKPVLAP